MSEVIRHRYGKRIPWSEKPRWPTDEKLQREYEQFCFDLLTGKISDEDARKSGWIINADGSVSKTVEDDGG